MPKLLYFITEDWVFCSHRLPLGIAAREAGFEVCLATNVNKHSEIIQRTGIKLIPLQLDRGSLNPLKELVTLFRLIALYRKEKPDIVHHVAIKPVIYGSLAARFSGVKGVVNALTGMGYVFTSDQLKARLMRPFINTALKALLNGKNFRLIMQNQDDATMLMNSGIVRDTRTKLIRGAGVDTKEFFFSPLDSNEVPLVILPARMLVDKGVREFVEAARILQQRGIKGRCVLVGDTDLHNPAAISVEQLRAWESEGCIEWWDRQDDMPAILAQSSVVCLPSYREGLPKALLEAASSGRPIVTTDTIGCREVVVHGDNGFLVPVRSTVELSDALHVLIKDPELRKRMGARGREIALQNFTVEKVIAQTLAVYEELVKTDDALH